MKCGEQIKFLAFANDVEFLDQENYISVVALIEGWEEMLEIEINDTDLTRFLGCQGWAFSPPKLAIIWGI